MPHGDPTYSAELTEQEIAELARASGGVRPSDTWLRLYREGLVHPPYRGKANRKKFAELSPPIRLNWTNDDLLRALGRTHD